MSQAEKKRNGGGGVLINVHRNMHKTKTAEKRFQWIDSLKKFPNLRKKKSVEKPNAK
jgi:hypothetical protein